MAGSNAPVSYARDSMQNMQVYDVFVLLLTGGEAFHGRSTVGFTGGLIRVRPRVEREKRTRHRTISNVPLRCPEVGNMRFRSRAEPK